jgi:hypothetical protein
MHEIATVAAKFDGVVLSFLRINQHHDLGCTPVRLTFFLSSLISGRRFWRPICASYRQALWGSNTRLAYCNSIDSFRVTAQQNYSCKITMKRNSYYSRGHEQAVIPGMPW